MPDHDRLAVQAIALATVTDGRLNSRPGPRADGVPVVTRRQAKECFGLPDFVGHGYEPGDEPGSTLVTLLSTGYPETVAGVLLGVARDR